MTDYDLLQKETGDKFIKALDHLEYSHNKVLTLPDDLSEMDDRLWKPGKVIHHVSLVFLIFL